MTRYQSPMPKVIIGVNHDLLEENDTLRANITDFRFLSIRSAMGSMDNESVQRVARNPSLKTQSSAKPSQSRSTTQPNKSSSAHSFAMRQTRPQKFRGVGRVAQTGRMTSKETCEV